MCSTKTAAALLAGKKRVAILTGSGISVLSEVKTTIGEDELQRQQEKMFDDHNDPNEILTRTQFMQASEKVWDWHYNFL